MYVFEYGATQNQIEKSLGTNFPAYVEFTRRIVFLKSGSIVYREDEPTSIEEPVPGQVSFVESSAGPYYADSHSSFTPTNAVFRAEKVQFSGGVYYVLTQVE